MSTIVLLSGGMDSTAAFHLTLNTSTAFRAVGFDYGQPHARRELGYAEQLCSKYGIEFRTLSLSNLMAGGLLGSPTSGGVSPAFVPARNLLLCTVVAGLDREGDTKIVLGVCADDERGFPDCRQETLTSLARTLTLGLGRTVHIDTPWIRQSKREILESVRFIPNALDDIQDSYSCYRGDGPCAECPACLLRMKAFAECCT